MFRKWSRLRRGVRGNVTISLGSADHSIFSALKVGSYPILESQKEWLSVLTMMMVQQSSKTSVSLIAAGSVRRHLINCVSIPDNWQTVQCDNRLSNENGKSLPPWHQMYPWQPSPGARAPLCTITRRRVWSHPTNEGFSWNSTCQSFECYTLSTCAIQDICTHVYNICGTYFPLAPDHEVSWFIWIIRIFGFVHNH